MAKAEVPKVVGQKIKTDGMIAKADQKTKGLELNSEKFFLEIERHLLMLERMQAHWFKELTERFPPRPGYCWSLEDEKLTQSYWGRDDSED